MAFFDIGHRARTIVDSCQPVLHVVPDGGGGVQFQILLGLVFRVLFKLKLDFAL